MNETIAAQLKNMAALQDKHNAEVHPDWRHQGYEYYRAVWIECAELMDHYGWKWWKHQVADDEQVRLEIIDIWHFGLSDLMRADALDDGLADRFSRADAGPATGDFKSAVERLAHSSLTNRAFDVDAFIDVMCAVGMSNRELYEVYIGKNVLNSFRQAHGYKAGTYRKNWDGREDNEHLAEIVAALDPTLEQFAELLYQELARRYADTTAA